MVNIDNGKCLFESVDFDQVLMFFFISVVFIGYCFFLFIMNFYSNFLGVVNVLKIFKFCGVIEDDFFYFVEVYFGFIFCGFFYFGFGYYFCNGISFKSFIFVVMGDEFLLLFFVQFFRLKMVVKFFLLYQEKNFCDMIIEVVYFIISKEYGVVFGFEIEVGVKRMMREVFEWWKISRGSSNDNQNMSG